MQNPSINLCLLVFYFSNEDCVLSNGLCLTRQDDTGLFIELDTVDFLYQENQTDETSGIGIAQSLKIKQIWEIPKSKQEVLTPACPLNLRITLPEPTSHKITVLSELQEQIWLLS